MAGSISAPDVLQRRQNQPLSADLKANVMLLQELLVDCPDLILHDFICGEGTRAVILYAAGQTDKPQLELQVLMPLSVLKKEREGESLAVSIRQQLPVAETSEVTSIDELLSAAFLGNPGLLLEGETTALIFGMAEWEKRAIEEPMAESVIRGPREGFTETLSLNQSMLRRRLRTTAFKMKTLTIGRVTQTRVVVAFLETVAEPELVEEVLQRIGRIDIDGILESGNIEEMIQDSNWSPFPQLLSTERPDVATSALLEGRVAILVEGTPFVLIAPTSLFSLMQSSEDYYQRFWLGTIIRWLRYTFVLIALLFPSIYIAILTYHQEMVPTMLLLTIAKSREEIPFPALVEALLMEFTFEALREAGVRLPKQVGSAVSIVGALVIGQAATAAGIVSPPMVMVVALTGIASFMIPHYTIGISVRLLRFPIMLLAGMLGLLGVILGMIGIVIHLCSLRSFGQPFLVFFTAGKREQWRDTLIRAPIWAMNKRPDTARQNEKLRQSPGNKPSPDQRKEGIR